MDRASVPVKLSAHSERETRRAALPLVERLTVNDAWAINTYVACDIRCSYCITQAQGVSTPREPRASVASRLRRELDAVTVDHLVVGPFCDVYPSPEVDLRVTRAALEVLVERELGFILVTKGPTVVRDADLLRHPDTVAQISLCSLDAGALERLEPGAAPPQARLRALHQLADRGVRVVVQASPWIPGLTDLAALRAQVDPAIPIQVTPLRMPPDLDRARRAWPYDQTEINAAYVAEYERRIGELDLLWSRPPPVDGTPPHIRDNAGRRMLANRDAAPPAPDPGPRPFARRTPRRGSGRASER